MRQSATNAQQVTTVPHLMGNSSVPGGTTARQGPGLTGGHAPGARTVTHWGCTRRANVSLVQLGNIVMGRVLLGQLVGFYCQN